MASVTGMTAEAIDAALDTMIVGITVDPGTGEMFAHPRNGDPISAGAVIAPKLAVEKAYPVGSIYISAAAGGVNPADASMLGIGVWTRFGKGRTIVSLDEAQVEFDGLEEMAGEKTHAITTLELPVHAHDIALQYVATGANGGASTRVTDISNATGAGGTAATGHTANVGHGDALSLLQPYIVVYMWKRTA